MRTVSEWEEHVRQQEAIRWRKFVDACLAVYLDVSSRDIALYQRPLRPGEMDASNTPERREATRQGWRAFLKDPPAPAFGGIFGHAVLLNLRCDHCQARLIDCQPNAVRTSYPPQIVAACAGCGWSGCLPETARRAQSEGP